MAFLPEAAKTCLHDHRYSYSQFFSQNYPVYVGIDCGVHTGWAVYDSQQKQYLELRTLDFWKAIDALQALSFAHTKKNICVVVEDPAQVKNIFLQRKGSINSEEVRKVLKVAQDVGGVKRESALLIKWLENNAFNYIAVKPTQSKITVGTQFNALTGWQGKSSQHARDAAMLVRGR